MIFNMQRLRIMPYHYLTFYTGIDLLDLRRIEFSNWKRLDAILEKQREDMAKDLIELLLNKRNETTAKD